MRINLFFTNFLFYITRTINVALSAARALVYMRYASGLVFLFILLACVAKIGSDALCINRFANEAIRNTSAPGVFYVLWGACLPFVPLGLLCKYIAFAGWHSSWHLFMFLYEENRRGTPGDADIVFTITSSLASHCIDKYVYKLSSNIAKS